MADGLPPRPDAGADEPPRQEPGAQPPPLDAIRIKGPGAKGLNKPAILAVAGGGVAVVLVLASGAFSTDASRKPADAKPMMSDPVRPEVAQGAVRNLPANYSEAAAREAALEPAQPPQLGPPLPGDVAAFAPQNPDQSTHAPYQDDWSTPDPYRPQQSSYAAEPVDPAVVEAEEAERSALFFALREAPSRSEGTAQQAAAPQSPTGSPLTMIAPQTSNDQTASRSVDRALFPGAVIPASLVTEISSESPGPVMAQITQAIYDSATGRTLLIPQGARLIGDYKSSTRYGQSRVAIIWSRIIMPDGHEIALDEAATDPSGSAGVTGKVDNHWLDVFGAAALGTLINIGVASNEDPQLTYGGIGVITRDPVDAAIADGPQRTASIVTNRVVDRSLAIPPTIRVDAGKRISVVATRRMSF
jgi:type IV secretory pathway VirB10-like protein